MNNSHSQRNLKRKRPTSPLIPLTEDGQIDISRATIAEIIRHGHRHGKRKKQEEMKKIEPQEEEEEERSESEEQDTQEREEVEENSENQIENGENFGEEEEGEERDEEAEEEEEEGEEDNHPRLRMKLGPDGKIILDENSAVFTVQPSRVPPTLPQRKRKIPSSNRRWTTEETEQFYKALCQYGTDFSTIEKIMNRDRKQIKNKFKKEEKENPKRIEQALNAVKRIGYFLFPFFKYKWYLFLKLNIK